MPNWCSNRMYFSGEPAQIAEIKRLASGAVTPLYRRSTNEGILSGDDERTGKMDNADPELEFDIVAVSHLF